MGSTFTLLDRDPEEVLEYVMDFTAWVEAGDEIQTSGTSVALDGVSVPSGDTDLTIDSVVVGANLVVAWLSGGNEGEKYTLKWLCVDNNNPVRTVVRRATQKMKTR